MREMIQKLIISLILCWLILQDEPPLVFFQSNLHIMLLFRGLQSGVKYIEI